MNEMLQGDDPIRSASAVLACARRLRPHADVAAAGEPDETCRSLGALLEALGKPEGFSEAFLDDLRDVIAEFDARVSAGTTVGYEVHDAWTERGAETTVVRPVEEMNPEARQLAVLLSELRRLALLVEATLDLVAAESIVAALRARAEPLPDPRWVRGAHQTRRSR